MKHNLMKYILLFLFLSAWSSMANDALIGKWRGVLDIQKNVSLAIGINVSDTEQGLTVTLDSPNQGMFDREPSSFNISDNKVSFTDKQLNIKFDAELKNGVLETKFKQGRAFTLDLQKLEAADLARLEYEDGYGGSLLINGEAKLPLVLRVAVVKGGYVAKLDSPAQQSFGIPIDEFNIDDKQLNFTSPIIYAFFEGQLNEQGYVGIFSQGLEHKLTLKKGFNPMSETTAANKFGKHGGAIALIENGEVKQRFFKSHNEQTQYEIGSVTKTMTAYLLAKQLAEKALNEDASIQQCFPDAGGNTSLLSLATHSSGLPRLPADFFDQVDAKNPYVDYDLAKLEQALASATLEHKSHLYSNFAYGVLGECLAKLSTGSYSDLLNQQVFKSMTMPASYVAVSSSIAGRYLSQGFDSLDGQSSHWYFDALAGAGAVVSNLTDMTKYLKAMMTLEQQQPELAAWLLTPRIEIDGSHQQALGWIIAQDDTGKNYAWHNGQTGGYTCFIGFYLDGSKGIVMLNNQSHDFTKDAVALLTGKAPLYS